MTQKALNLLGLCARAGMLKSGEQMAEQLIKRGTAKLALMDEGASERSKRDIKTACEQCGVRLVFVPDGALGHSIGKPGRMAVVVTDEGFANRIWQLFET